MSKDNETIHPPIDGPLTSSATPRFAPDEMIRCETCLRANPPTRLKCMYCEAALEHSESSAHLRKPTLRQPEKHEPGFNCILIPGAGGSKAAKQIEDAAALLKLNPAELRRIIDADLPLPLARTSSREEAALVSERLRALLFESVVVADADLGFSEELIVRPRSFQIMSDELKISLPNIKGVVEIDWSDIHLVVSGRLVTTSIEVSERMSRKSENEILDTSEFFSDEAVFDIYDLKHEQTWRIGSLSFDFSCLQDQKTLVAGENLKRLNALIISKTRSLRVEDSYKTLQPILEPVWPRETETKSRGWRRDGPGKYSLGATTLHSNEAQFTRYSRLCRYLAVNPLA